MRRVSFIVIAALVLLAGCGIEGPPTPPTAQKDSAVDVKVSISGYSGVRSGEVYDAD